MAGRAKAAQQRRAVTPPPAAPARRTRGGLTPSQIRAFFMFLFAAALIVYVIAQQGSASAPAEGSAEAGFARDMKTHHAQAVEMAMIVRDRTDDPDVDSLMTDMILTQQNQIGQFEGWLGVWDLPLGTDAKPMAWMGHEVDGRMPGMASSEEIAALSTLPHDEMIVEFCRLMIVHHQSAVDMAEAVLEPSDNPVVERLARSIIATQEAEIDRLEGILARYEGSGGDPAATPGASPIAGTPEATPEHSH
jgi:uncharacterized protein (DUF305 family)